MVEMSCTEHDKYVAGSQLITHTMGRILEKQLDTMPINTKRYKTLLNLVENMASDSFDLYYGLFMYNKNAMEQLERLDLAFEALNKELFGHLHEALRKQLFGKLEEGCHRRPMLAKLPKNGTPLLPPQSEAIANKSNYAALCCIRYAHVFRDGVCHHRHRRLDGIDGGDASFDESLNINDVFDEMTQ